MNDNVSQLQRTTAAKRQLGALHDAAKLPAIETGSIGHDDDGDAGSHSEEKEEAVVKLKLHDRYAVVNKIPERRVRKRSRIPSERLSLASSSISISNSDVELLCSPPNSPPKSPVDIPQVRVIIPNVSYEEDERLRLTPHIDAAEKSATQPQQGDETFRYATPIPPPRSENLSAMGKVSRAALDEDIELSTAKDTKILKQNSPMTSNKTTASSGEDCGHDTGAELDTQNLSNAIQKLRKKMGIKVSMLKNGYAHQRSSFKSFQRTGQSKTKKRRKERKQNSDNTNDALKLKSRKLAKKTEKLPNIYDKFARHRSSTKVQYMNILK